MSGTDLLSDKPLHTEEVFAPPRIDTVGLGLIVLSSVVIGFLSGIFLFLFAFFIYGQSFSAQSGASPILLAMVSFFVFTLSDYLYIWALTYIFPHIFSRTRTLFVQVSVFSILLYITLILVYIIFGSLTMGTSMILWVFIIHILLNAFGLIVITGILSQYRYSLLVFYANLISLIVTGLIMFFVSKDGFTSNSILFTFMGLPALGMCIATMVTFGLQWLYYQLYMFSGFDPIGDVFHRIEQEEKDLELAAENQLFHK